MKASPQAKKEEMKEQTIKVISKFTNARNGDVGLNAKTRNELSSSRPLNPTPHPTPPLHTSFLLSLPVLLKIVLKQLSSSVTKANYEVSEDKT